MNPSRRSVSLFSGTKEVSMKAKLATFLAIVSLLGSQSATAVYTRTSSGPVDIGAIYANEWGSPFVYFTTSINPACSGGTGLYLYDITASQPDWNLRKGKLAVLLTAKAAQKKVTLDYFYDSSIVGWTACYILGIQIVD